MKFHNKIFGAHQKFKPHARQKMFQQKDSPPQSTIALVAQALYFDFVEEFQSLKVLQKQLHVTPICINTYCL